MTDAELDLPEKSMEPIYEQIERNLVYSNNPCFNKEERKNIYFLSWQSKMAEMKEAVKLARVPQNYHTKWKTKKIWH
jgi:hypothetical protein